LHWVLACGLLAQVILGWWMLSVPKTPPGLRASWFNVHKSIGLTLAVLVLVRLAWRITHPVEQSAQLPSWQQRAARATHRLLYILMLLLPLSGYLGSTFTRYPVRYFGMVLPSWNVDWPAAKALRSAIHYGAVWLFMFVVALHVAAALRHWWLRDGVAARMGFLSR
jgi:cytochrome b561